MVCSLCKEEGHNLRTCLKRTPQCVVMGEVQAHGFTWEKELLLNVYKLTPTEIKEIKYTSKHDLPSSLNRLNRCDVSIKTTCNPNSVCMADALRLFDNVNTIHMIVIHYKQVETMKQVVSITEVDLKESRALLFGEVTREQIEQLDALVKKVPQKRKPTAEEHASMYALRDSLSKGGALRLDIKCNSTQSRLQCSFHRFQDFLEKYPERIVTKSETHEFRGGTITPSLVSSKRIFKPK